MNARSLLLCASVFLLHATRGQMPVVVQGTPFNKTSKTYKGDVHQVVDGVVVQGRPVVFVSEGFDHKVFRLDGSQTPAEELSLKDVMLDGKKWNGVASVVRGQDMFCLLMSNGKKSCDFGIAQVNTSGAPSLTGFHPVATFDAPYVNDPSLVTAKKTLPDLILFDNGIAYDEHERIVRSPDGEHYLVNYYTRDTKGNKLFYYACLDRDFAVQWSGMKELPYPDLQSDVHQVLLDNNGRVHVLSYVYRCESEGQASNKLCHETHLTTISEQGATVKDVLVDKDFVSSARVRPLDNGRMMVALRYGALTGHPGMLVDFDPADAKLKATPLVDQRLPSIRKVKLTTFGDPNADPKKAARASAKTADDIIEVLPAWDGGTLLLEEYYDMEHEVPMGDAIAIRHLAGAVRATYFDDRDSVRWQRVVERSFITTSGVPYESVVWTLRNDGLVLLFNQTPGGFDFAAAMEEKKDKKAAGALEPGRIRAALISRSGAVVADQIMIDPDDGHLFDPTSLVVDEVDQKAWLRSYDMGQTYRYAIMDLGALGK